MSARQTGGRHDLQPCQQEPASSRRQRSPERFAQQRIPEAEAVAIGCEEPLLTELFELLDQGQRVEVEDFGEQVGFEGLVDGGSREQDAERERAARSAALEERRREG